MTYALVLNDTRLDYHYGCFATSNALHGLLRGDGYDVRAISVDRIAKACPSPEDISDLTSDIFYQKFLEKNQDIVTEISDSLFVVINGEGTLHGFSHRPRNLLYLILVAKFFNKKPVYLVNHSLFPSDFSNNVDQRAFDFYETAVRYLDGIAAREARTQAIYRQMGILSVQAFDLLPLYAQSAGLLHNPGPRDPGTIVIGLGVGWPPEIAAQFAQAIKKCTPPEVQIRLLNGAPVQEPPQEEKYPPLMQRVDERIKTVFSKREGGRDFAMEAAAWIETITSARLLVTGRYHHVIAALAAGTPTIGLTSNTDKIESTLRMWGLGPNPLNPREEHFQERLEERLTKALHSEEESIVTNANQRDEILYLSRRNRIWSVDGQAEQSTAV